MTPNIVPNISPYLPRRLLERDQHAEVWLAQHPETPGWFEITVPYPYDDPHLDEVLTRLLGPLEGKASQELQGVTELLWRDAPEGPGGAIVCPHIPGVGLRALVRRGIGVPMGPAQVATLAHHLCAGLTRLASWHHAAPPSTFVHRDLSAGRIRLGPLGLARLGCGELPAQWRQRTVMGAGVIRHSFCDLSPEQVRGLELTPASDVYQLGALMFLLLTGKEAFKGTTDFDTLHLIIQGRRVSASSLAPDLPARLEKVLDAALSLDPAARPQDPAALALALEDTGLVSPLPEILRSTTTSSVLTWLRDQLHATPLAAFDLVTLRPGVLSDPAVLDYLTQHALNRSRRALDAGRLPPWPIVALSGSLAPARAILRQWARDPHFAPQARLLAGWMGADPEVELPEALSAHALAPPPAQPPEASPPSPALLSSGQRATAPVVFGPVEIHPCARTWDSLDLGASSPNDSVRFCQDCQRQVHRARNLADLMALTDRACVCYGVEPPTMEPPSQEHTAPNPPGWDLLSRLRRLWR